MAVATTLSACGSHPAARPAAHVVRGSGVADGQRAFLATGDAWAVLVRWTATGTQLIGTLDSSGLGSDVTGGQTQLTGTINGSAVSLSVNGQTWTGEVHGTSLTLHIPQSDGSLRSVELGPGDIDAYNSAVAALHGQATANAQASAAANAAAAADQAVRDTDRKVSSDLADLAQVTKELPGDADFSDDLATAAKDLGTARDDLATTQQDAQASPEDCGTVGTDANGVDTDANGVETDSNGVDTTANGVDGDLSRVKDDRSALATDFAALTAAENADPRVSGTHSASEVQTAEQAARRAAATAQAAEQTAKAKAASLLTQARQLATQAQQIADRCTN